MDSKEESSPGGSNNTSTLYFFGNLGRQHHGSFQAITLQVQNQEVLSEWQQSKEANNNFVTKEVWKTLEVSGGETVQKKLEYLNDLHDKLEAKKEEWEE